MQLNKYKTSRLMQIANSHTLVIARKCMVAAQAKAHFDAIRSSVHGTPDEKIKAIDDLIARIPLKEYNITHRRKSFPKW